MDQLLDLELRIRDQNDRLISMQEFAKFTMELTDILWDELKDIPEREEILTNIALKLHQTIKGN